VSFTITKLARDPDHGYWTARVTPCGGTTVCVDRQFGSWQATVRDAPGLQSFHREFVLPPVAAALQERVRPIERAERAAAKLAEEQAKVEAAQAAEEVAA
jgi:hypothetical protein